MKAKLKLDKYIVNPTLTVTLKVGARRKGEPRTSIEVPVDTDTKDLLRLVEAAASVKPRARSLPKELITNLDFLQELGVLIPESQVPASVSADSQLTLRNLDFVPGSDREEGRETLKGKLVFNRGLVRLPEEIVRMPPKYPGIPPESAYPYGKSFLWVLDPGTQMWSPYGLDAPTLNRVRELMSGRRKPAQLDENWRELFLHARIITPNGYREERERYWRTHWMRQRQSLKSKRFAVLRKILCPMQIAIARAYFRGLESEGYLDLDLKQVKQKRFAYHNDPVLQYWHRQSGRLIRHVTGEDVIPSYSYLSAYMKGSRLKRHLDRPQCVWNASLLIDQQPEVPVAESWPIYLETPKETAEVRLDFGDCVLYSGTELPHWRDRIPAGHRQTLGLLHYVPVDFVGNLD